ncbi:unnamed protein product, partial [Closterium sp. NIES-54]
FSPAFKSKPRCVRHLRLPHRAKYLSRCVQDLQNRAGPILFSASSASSTPKALSLCNSRSAHFLGSSLLLHSLGGEGAWSRQASSASRAHRRSCSTFVHAMAAGTVYGADVMGGVLPWLQ